MITMWINSMISIIWPSRRIWKNINDYKGHIQMLIFHSRPNSFSLKIPHTFSLSQGAGEGAPLARSSDASAGPPAARSNWSRSRGAAAAGCTGARGGQPRGHQPAPRQHGQRDAGAHEWILLRGQAGATDGSTLKGSLTRDFRLHFFSWISVPQAPKYSIGAVLNFFENSRRYLRMNI